MGRVRGVAPARSPPRVYKGRRPRCRGSGHGGPSAPTQSTTTGPGNSLARAPPPRRRLRRAPQRKASSMPLAALLWVIGPLILIGGLMLYVARRGGMGSGTGTSSGGVGNQLKMRKSARVTTPSIRFGDVAGCDEAVEELAEMVELLREPERFRALGARMPRGVILWGPPGTGKTLLAKAVAGEAG